MQYFMLRRRLKAFFAVLILSGFGLAAARADQPLDGWWLDHAGDAAIIIAPCGTELCGHIEWLRTPLNVSGQPKTDIHNPDASLRPRRLCGLAMLGGFSPDGAGGWQGGWIYDPKTGNTYKSVMHVATDGTLHVRGYIGIPLLGRSEIMTRPATAPVRCVGYSVGG